MSRGTAIYKTQMNRLKDGRGHGYGKEDYKPFIQASDNKAPQRVTL
ncbi:hypothetical protein [Paenibacillus germinis]|nr:hypothetical protein [Paenibacillus germinis]